MPRRAKRAPRSLSDLHIKVVELRDQGGVGKGLAFPEIAKTLAITKLRAMRYYREAQVKPAPPRVSDPASPPAAKASAAPAPAPKKKPAPPKKKSGGQTVEDMNPDQAAEAIVMLALPDSNPNFERMTTEEIAEHVGLSKVAVRHLAKKMRRQWVPLKLNIEKIKLDQFGDMLLTQAYNIGASITPQEIVDASLKDKAIALGIMTEKGLLVKGRPTVITDDNRRRKLGELLGVVIESAKRRGILKEPGTIIEAEVLEAQASA